MLSIIHRDLLPIIFSYMQLNNHNIISAISRQCRKLSSVYHYHYFAYLGKYDIMQLFRIGCKNNLPQLVANCSETKYSCYYHDTITWVLSYGEPAIIKLWADKRGYPGDSIVTASYYGNIKMVEFLLTIPVIDPTVDDNRAIRCASINKYTVIIRLLLNDLRVYYSLTDWVREYLKFRIRETETIEIKNDS